MNKQILVGCDPEVFVKQGNVFKSAHSLIPGTKDVPFKVDKGAVQVDGMALEFNIDPASTEDEFVTNVTTVFETLIQMVPEYQIEVVPVAHFDKEYMDNQPREALELGCTPDYNAWTGDVNLKPDGERAFRTASGHIHIGWTKGKDVHQMQHVLECRDGIKQMDFFLGLPSLFWDEDQERRTMYGKAGCMRVKPYGFEYRTLSNAWLKSEHLMRFVYKNAILGMERMFKGDYMADTGYDVQEIINNSDKEAAEFLMNKFGIPGV